jgi:hypothetical protein
MQDKTVAEPGCKRKQLRRVENIVRALTAYRPGVRTYEFNSVANSVEARAAPANGLLLNPLHRE